MWLNEFKSGDIVSDVYDNVLEIKQIFKTGNVKIKVLNADNMDCSDFSGNIINPESIGKTYIIYPFGDFENDWELVEKEEIQISTPIEILTVEQIDSQISELQKKKEEIVNNQLNNLVKGKFYQIVGSRNSIYNCFVTDWDEEGIFINTFDDGGIISMYELYRLDIKSIKPLPELDEAYSKFLTVLEKFS